MANKLAGKVLSSLALGCSVAFALKHMRDIKAWKCNLQYLCVDLVQDFQRNAYHLQKTASVFHNELLELSVDDVLCIFFFSLCDNWYIWPSPESNALLKIDQRCSYTIG